MARADYLYDSAYDPEEQQRRLAEVFDEPVMPPPPEEDHPMVAFAKNLLSPITDQEAYQLDTGEYMRDVRAENNQPVDDTRVEEWRESMRDYRSGQPPLRYEQTGDYESGVPEWRTGEKTPYLGGGASPLPRRPHPSRPQTGVGWDSPDANDQLPPDERRIRDNEFFRHPGTWQTRIDDRSNPRRGREFMSRPDDGGEPIRDHGEDARDRRLAPSTFDQLSSAQGQRLPGDLRGPRPGEKAGRVQIGELVDGLLDAGPIGQSQRYAASQRDLKNLTPGTPEYAAKEEEGTQAMMGLVGGSMKNFSGRVAGRFGKAENAAVPPPSVVPETPPVTDALSAAVAHMTPEQAADRLEAIVNGIPAKAPEFGPRRIGNLNLDRIGVSPKTEGLIKQTFEQNADEILAAVGDPVTHADTLSAAKRLVEAAEAQAIPYDEFIKRLQQNGLSPVNVTASRIANVKQAARAGQVADDVAIRKGDPEAIVAAAREQARAIETMKTLAGTTAQSGRTLDSFNIVVEEANEGIARGVRDINGHFSQALRKVAGIEAEAKLTKFNELLARIPRDDTPALIRFMHSVDVELQGQAVKKAKAADFAWWAKYTYVNSLLGPVSAARNLLGTGLKIPKTLAEMYGTVDVGSPAGKTAGIPLAAANAFTAAMFTRGVTRGSRRAFHIFSHRMVDDFTKTDEAVDEMLSYPQNFIGARIADGLGIIPRAMRATDGLFKAMFEEGYVAMSAHIDAAKLPKAERAAFVEKTMNRPEYERLMKARDFGKEYTWNREAGDKTETAIKLRNKIPYGAGRQFIAFISTPANIYRDAVQMTPLGLPPIARLAHWSSKGATGEPGIGAKITGGSMGEAETAMRYSRAILGTTAMAAIWNQFEAGNITGFNPYRPGTTEWDIWNKDNVEMGVKIPFSDKQVSLANMPPFSQIVRWVAAVRQENAAGREVNGMTIAQTAVRLADTSFDDSFFANVSGLLNAIENPDRFLNSFLQRQVQSRIPMISTLRLGTNIQGATPRDAITWDDYAKAAMPELWKDVRPKLGAFGPVESRGNAGSGALIPQRVVEPHASDNERHLLYLKQFGLVLPEPVQRGQPGNTELNDTDLYRLKEVSYPKMLEALDTTMADPTFRSLPVKEQISKLEKAFRGARDVARMEFVKDYLLPQANTVEQQKTVAFMGLGVISTYKDEAYFLEELSKVGKLPAEVKHAIDDARPPKQQGELQRPSVDEYLKVAPLVRQYLQIPPYTIGDQAEWTALAEARKFVEAYAKSNPKPSGMADWQWASSANHGAANLVRKYSYEWVRSPKRAELMKQHPELRRYLDNTTYTQVP